MNGSDELRVLVKASAIQQKQKKHPGYPQAVSEAVARARNYRRISQPYGIIRTRSRVMLDEAIAQLGDAPYLLVRKDTFISIWRP